MGRHRKRKKKLEYVYIPPVVEYIYNTKYKLEIKDSLIKYGGQGVFALEDIPENTCIGEYTGEKKHKDDFTLGTYSLQLSSDYSIDAFDYPRCILAMINDARFSDYKYNCDFVVNDIIAEIWSISAINIGSELYIEYGDFYWKHR